MFLGRDENVKGEANTTGSCKELSVDGQRESIVPEHSNSKQF